MNSTHTLTQFQVDEVDGLLQVTREEEEISGERTPWGRVDGTTLTVWDADDAIDDINDRADLLEDAWEYEGPGVRGQARSLRKLADAIEAAR